MLYLTRQKNLVQIMITYVAFAGVSKLDNAYVEATNKMKAAKVLLDCKGDARAKLVEAIGFDKQQIAPVKYLTFF